MTAATSVTWSLDGEFLENCNCTVLCPCTFSPAAPFTSMPTEGTCDVTFNFHIDRGAFGDVSLDGLNLALLAHIPGPMIEGNWQVALYIDERSDDRQQEALTAIFSGAAGGVLGAFAPLITEVLGVKRVPIVYVVDGKRRSVTIPEIMSMAVRPLPTAIGEDKEMVAVGAHPFAPDGVVLGVGEPGYSLTDYGFAWDNSGKNGHYAAFHWSNS
jgi:hypothetical protein